MQRTRVSKYWSFSHKIALAALKEMRHLAVPAVEVLRIGLLQPLREFRERLEPVSSRRRTWFDIKQ
jgi:hypothetical protein